MADKVGKTLEQLGEYNDRVRAKAIEACYAINPSNPMAVAEGLTELVKEAQEWVESEFGRPRGLRGRMMTTLAAITKPATGDKDE